jgi:hypothetical protein
MLATIMADTKEEGREAHFLWTSFFCTCMNEPFDGFRLSKRDTNERTNDPSFIPRYHQGEIA